MKTFLAVALCVLFASSVAMAQNAPPAGGPAAPPPALAKSAVAWGPLTKIDGKTLTITPLPKPDRGGQGDLVDVVMTADDNTKIRKYIVTNKTPTGTFTTSAAAKFEDLQVGQLVSAVYAPDTKVVKEIAILPPTWAPAPAPANPAPAK